jgi:hypothetical protein
MKHFITFNLESGGVMTVEVDEPMAEGGLARAARPGEVIEKAGESFETAMDKIKPAAVAVIGKLRDLADPPDDIEVEFGIKLTAAAGAVLASAGVEANYKVTLKWQKKTIE